MNYSTWEARISSARQKDPLWRMRAYRLATYLSTITWHDASKLARCRVTTEISPQLYKAVGSITSNMSEGYSRSSGRDRARIFEYALGSARESREWYWRAEPVLGAMDDRQELLDEVIRLLVVTIPREREVIIEPGRY
jgi:four helix bundle protein